MCFALLAGAKVRMFTAKKWRFLQFFFAETYCHPFAVSCLYFAAVIN